MFSSTVSITVQLTIAVQPYRVEAALMKSFIDQGRRLAQPAENGLLQSQGVNYTITA